MSQSIRRVVVGVNLFLMFCCASVWAQLKPTLTPKDYGKWETLGGTTLSPNGKWMAYGMNRVDGTYELRYRELPDKTVVKSEGIPPKDPAKILISGGSPAFSADSHWLACSVGYSETEREKLTKSGKPVQNKINLVELATGKVTAIENIANFAFCEAGGYLALHSYTIKGRESKGADLIVRDLNTGTDTNFGNVSRFAWQDKGVLLAMIVDAEGKKGNGVQVYEPVNGTLHTLDSAEAVYTGLTWRKKSDDLAVMRVKKDDKYEDETHLLLAWTNLSRKQPTKKTYDSAQDKTFPQEIRIVDKRGLTWSDDGKSLFVGIKEWEKKPEKSVTSAKKEGTSSVPASSGTPPEKGTPPKSVAGMPPAKPEDDEPAGVEVWHAKDTDILPEQKKRIDFDKSRSYFAVWNLVSRKFVQLTNTYKEELELAKGEKYGLLSNHKPYQKEQMFGPNYADLYAVEIETGKRTLIKNKVEFPIGTSAGGHYVLYLQDDQYYAYQFRTGQTVNLTKDVPTKFINVEDDHTTKQKPPFGLAGWTQHDSAVLIYDKFDIWSIKPDGSEAKRLTNGGAEQIVHRYVSLDPEEEFIDMGRPLMLSLYGEQTKWYGYGRLRGRKPVERLVWKDKRVDRLTKAKEAETYVCAVQDFQDSPNYLAFSADIKEPQSVTETNPFQKDYAWGHAELVDYESKYGKKLQGGLFYPANYDSSKTYPMIVYIYEKLSQNLHNYSTPNERNPYNPAVFTANGYFVLMPDIVYRDRQPGFSAVACIVPAVEKVIQSGKIDRKRIGLVGHSWGAYQTAFVVTQTDIFAAAVAGAPLTDLISMYLSVYWNSGSTDARIFEISQGRMQVPFWEDMNAYMTNSPLFNIQKLKTPLMIAFGNQDGAVDWHQGIELYNAARRADKEMVMLVYEGENHGLAKKPNQLDYHRRIRDWFGHYLKGDAAPKWITEGMTYLDRQKELEHQKKDANKEK